MPLAYFLTFTTYGTWLHGTDKGAGSVDREHNVYGEELVAPDEERMKREREAMTQPPYVLDAPRRVVVCEAIVELCRGKAWGLLALHVRSNHVHVVISADREPGRLMSDLKARASRELTRAGFETTERIRWTRHGSTLHLFQQSVVEEKVEYTLCQQGERMAWYDGNQNEPRTR